MILREILRHSVDVNMWMLFLLFVTAQEGDGDFSQISSEENDLQLDDELPSNIVSIWFFKRLILVTVCNISNFPLIKHL